MTRPWPLRLLLVADGVSITGSAMTLLAVPWFVLVTTHSAARTGLVGACETVPLVLASALGGPLIDRIGARRVAVGSDALSAVGIALIPLLHSTTGLRFWQLCLVVAFVGLCRAPGETARHCLIPKLVELAGTPMERAASAFDGVSRGSRMLGAPIAGALIAAIGPANVMLVDAVSFVLSALIVTGSVPFARVADVTDPEPYFAQLKGGIAGMRADRLLTGIVAMVLLTNLLDAAMGTVLMPVYARQVLHSSVALGVLFATFGLGALSGTVVYGIVGPRLPRWPVYVIAFFLVGGPRFGLFAAHTTYPLLLVGQFLVGIGCGSLNPILSAVEFERIPATLQSRVFGVMSAGSIAGMPVGAVVGGLAVAQIGLTGALIGTGGLYTLVTLAPLVFPVWRELDDRRSALAGDHDLELDLHLVGDLERAEHL